MQIYEVINKYIQERGYKKYLEIGVFYGETFNNINIETKEGIDPDPKINDDRIFIGTVEDHSVRGKYDVVFIDGDHSRVWVEKDFMYALSKLKKGGMIFFHDVLPPTQWHARDKSKYTFGEEWCGQAAHVFIENDASPSDSDDLVYAKYIYSDVPYGLGVIDTSVEKDKVDYEHPETFDELQDVLKKLTMENEK